MAAVAGDPRPSSYYYFYPSPSSSPEGVQSSVQKGSHRSESVTAHPSPHPVSAKSTGLQTPVHTPSQSTDLSTVPDVVLAHRIKQIEDQILSSRGSLTPATVEGIEPAIWPLLREKLAEERDFRLQYDTHLRVLIVTWPADVHEGYQLTIQPLLRITAQDSRFGFATNTSIQFPEGPHIGETPTPDFALGRKGFMGHLEYGLVVECAYTQSSEDLKKRAYMWLTHPDVTCVVCIDLNSAAFSNPDANTARPTDPYTFERFAAEFAKTPFLGPLKIEKHTWGPKIKGINVTIYMKRLGVTESLEDGEKYLINSHDVTPTRPHDDLAEAQKEVIRTLYSATYAYLGKRTFKAIFPVRKDFTLDWGVFYQDLHLRLVSDAWKRYFGWLHLENVPTPIVKITASLNKRARDFYAAGETDSDSDAPSLKRQNQASSEDGQEEARDSSSTTQS